MSGTKAQKVFVAKFFKISSLRTRTRQVQSLKPYLHKPLVSFWLASQPGFAWRILCCFSEWLLIVLLGMYAGVLYVECIQIKLKWLIKHDSINLRVKAFLHGNFPSLGWNICHLHFRDYACFGMYQQKLKLWRFKAFVEVLCVQKTIVWNCDI